MNPPHARIRRPRRAVRTTVVAAAILLGISACTVPTNEEPVVLGGTILDTTTTTATTTPEAVAKEVVVYLLGDANGTTVLTPVPRSVDVSAGVQEILANLFNERPDGELRPVEAGLSTAIPESASLVSATQAENDPDRLVVDVRGLFGNEGIQGVDLRNSLAQIVWTATENGDFTEVVFRRDGEPVQALVDDLESTEDAVDRGDYSRQN